MEVLLKEITAARKMHSQLMAMETKTAQCHNALEKLNTVIETVNDCYEQLGMQQAAFTTELEPTQPEMHKTCSEATTGLARLKTAIGMAMTFKTTAVKKRKPMEFKAYTSSPAECADVLRRTVALCKHDGCGFWKFVGAGEASGLKCDAWLVTA